ncbi:hypothetical protein FLJC2902T_13480 [Flavobacterium limnosediminis JC2902]|uniref:HTH araC/xylS-type domain-containing protein n=2 Tax=Flavobacterium TaxID=237 RepID=V6SPZ7_9FLAO|nr:hypothetical protein FLJC2902T_13480 [Flavobacterium limnosediminis JC2902]
MILEMAQGNFVFQIERSKEDDELEGLTVLVNMMAQEMEASLLHLRYINPRYNYKNLLQAAFVLDCDFKIIHFTTDAVDLLGFDDKFLNNCLFEHLLTESSILLLNDIKSELNYNNGSITVSINYKTKTDLILPTLCTISKLVETENYIISFAVILREEKQDFNLSGTEERNDLMEKLSYADIQLIQKVYDYILANIDLPLPTIQELSRMFNTNEFKLKHVFRLMFNTSIYKFYTTERLKKAHLLIQQTTIPLKNIADLTGFSTYPNFSRAFKNHYGFTPNEIKRR